jgi:predicted permease
MSDSLWRRSRRIWRGNVQDEVDDEVDFHFRMRVEQFIAGGMSREDAERAARERFGDVTEVRTELVGIGTRTRRRVDLGERLHALRRDVVVSLRSLRREPLFTVGVIATLGLGIGANATMFGIIDRLMLRGPDHVVDAKQVSRLYFTIKHPTAGVITTSSMGYVSYATLRDRAASFAAVAAYSSGGSARYGTGTQARPITSARATWDLFPLLGVKPTLGRFWDSSEDHPPKGEYVAVVSYEFWQSELGADERVIGKQVTIDDALYTVVGVAPRGFTGPERVRADVWRPMSLLSPRDDWPTTWRAQWLRIAVRLKPGVTAENASAEATRLLRAAYDGPRQDMRQLAAAVWPLWYGDNGQPAPVANVSRWLMGVAVVVLLITCANVANLLVARTRRRRREIAVRLALGVGRAGLVRLLLIETMLVALGGALAAMVVAGAGGRLMRATLLSDVEWSGAGLDVRVFLFTLVVAVATGLLLGLGPALDATRLELSTSLKTGARDGGGRRDRARVVLSVAQAALSVVLLAGAALFVDSLWHARNKDLGFQPDKVVRVEMRFNLASMPEAQRAPYRAQVIAGAVERLRALPWVEHAAESIGSPFGFGFGVDVTIPGRDSLPQTAGGGATVSAVTSDYFATIGTPLRAGRTFARSDRAGSTRVAIVNETMARTVWPGDSPIGKCLLIGAKPTNCSSVVGVVTDVHRNSLREPAAMQYYIPVGQQEGFGGSVIVVRPRGRADAAIGDVKRAIAAMPNMPYVTVQTIQEAIDPELRPWQLGATMFGVFGMLALVIAAVGLYSVIAYLVADRTRELGVRIALGATGGRIVREVVWRGVATTGAGVVVGLFVALAAGRYIAPLLFDVSPRNPLVLGGVATLVLLIAVVASWMPARRAGRVDPVIALRAD